MRPSKTRPRAATRAQVVASDCTGLRRLSDEVGANLLHLACPARPTRQAHELSHRLYGARTIGEGDLGFVIEEGWRDWHPIPLQHAMTGGSPLCPGASLQAERLCVTLEIGMSRASFARRLELSLEPMRFDVALTSGQAVARRHAAGVRPLGIRSRYAGVADDYDWGKALQIYVFDPWRDLARLSVIACSAASDVFPTGDP